MIGETLILMGIILFVYMSMLFVLSLFLRNNGVADVGYGIGFLVLGISGYLVSDAVRTEGTLLLLLVLMWSLRLASRIFRKNKGKPEDFRYKQWRDAWGRTFVVRSFFQVYMLQGLIIGIIASPVVLSILFPESGSQGLFVLGVVVSLLGLTLEAISDAQLDRFLKDTSRTKRIMTEGLWHYSRHPNYFGESLVWIGFGIATITTQPFGVLSILSPCLITFLLLRVSGVPLLEKRWEGDPEWEAYKEKTSVFIPLPPRS